jgi:TIR domain-containing protein
MAKVFISYRRRDTDQIVGRIYERLESHFGEGTIFYDKASIPFGEQFPELLDEVMGKCRVALALVGDRWVEEGLLGPRLLDPNDYVRREIETALANGVKVIPVLIGVRTNMPGAKDLPTSMEKFLTANAATVDSGQDFHIHMARLIERIETILDETRAEKQPATRLARTSGEGENVLGHNFVNGVCTRCDRSRKAVEHFKWECKAESELSAGTPLDLGKDEARKRAARAAKKEQRLKKGIEELGWGEAPQQLSLPAPVLFGEKCPQGNRLSWTLTFGAGGYLLQRGSDESFLSFSEDIYEGEELGFIDPIGQFFQEVSLSPTRRWSPSFYYRVKAKAAPGVVSDSQWSNIVRV